MESKKVFYGVSVCVLHRTIGFLEAECVFMPEVAPAGFHGYCHWFSNEKDALNKAEQLVKQGFLPHRVFDYPNFYAKNAVRGHCRA